MTTVAQRGLCFPIQILLTEGRVSDQSLTSPLKEAEFVSVSGPGLSAKVVPTAHVPGKSTTPEYRLDGYGKCLDWAMVLGRPREHVLGGCHVLGEWV